MYAGKDFLCAFSLVTKERLWRENIRHYKCIRHFVLSVVSQNQRRRKWFATNNLYALETKTNKKCSGSFTIVDERPSQRIAEVCCFAWRHLLFWWHRPWLAKFNAVCVWFSFCTTIVRINENPGVMWKLRSCFEPVSGLILGVCAVVLYFEISQATLFVNKPICEEIEETVYS